MSTRKRSGGFAFAPRKPAHEVSRHRLVQLLDAAVRDPLVIVRAPAGGGKTVLLTEWAAQYPSSRRGAWVALDESTTTRLSFWKRVLDVIVEAGVAPADSFAARIDVGPEVAGELREMLRRGFAELDQSLVLVIDDYQFADDERIHDDVRWLLANVPTLHVVLSTRAVSSHEDSRNMATLATTVIDAAELRFTSAETTEAAARIGLDAQQAAALHDALGGWPLATQIAIVELELGRSSTVEEAVASVPRGSGSGAEILLNWEDDDRLLFLLRTSIAERLTLELAEQLAGVPAGPVFAWMEREGLGGWSPAAGAATFNYQPMVRTTLESELERRRPDEVPALRRTLAAWQSAHDEPLASIRQYAKIGDLGGMVAVAKRHRGLLFRLYGVETREVLERLPSAQLRRHPLLLVMLAISHYADPASTRERISAIAGLAMALARSQLIGGDPVERLWLLMAMMGSQRITGHYEQAADTSDKIMTIVAEFDEDQLAEVGGFMVTVWNMVAVSYLFEEQLDRALALLDQGLDTSERLNLPWGEALAHSWKLLIRAMRGDMDIVAADILHARARKRPEGWRGTYTGSGYHLAEAYLSLEMFDTATARTELAAIARHEATIEQWPVIARLRGMAALTDGEGFEGARVLGLDIAAHRKRPPISESMAALLTVTRVDLLIAAGQPDRARRAAGRSTRDATLAVALGRLELLAGRPERAVALASALTWTDQRLPRGQAEALLLTAIAARRTGNTSVARDSLDRALDVMAMHQLRQPLMMVPRGELLDLIAEHGHSAAILDGVPDVFPAANDVPQLTPREIRVLDELTRSGRTDDIAAALFVSSNTVKSQLRSIYRKLGVSSRDEALVIAHERGLLRSETD